MIDPRKDYSDAKWSRLYREYEAKYEKASSNYSMYPKYSFAEFKNVYVDVVNIRAEEGAEGIAKTKVINEMVKSNEKRETYKSRTALIRNLEEMAELEPEVKEYLKKTNYDEMNKDEWAQKFAYDFKDVLRGLDIKDWSIYFNS